MKLQGYTWRPVGSLKNDPTIDVVHGGILHVDAGNATSLYHWFDGPSGGIESTAFLPKSAVNNKEQYRDTTREADANFRANSWVEGGKRHGFTSLETQGFGSGSWNKYQLDNIKDFIMQIHKGHKVPLQVPKIPTGYGFGYHTLFKSWTNVPGKTCPGPKRIKQFNEIIVPWMTATAKQEKVKTYKVQKGDTAVEVADKFGLKVVELWRLNPGVSLPLKAGMILRVR